MLTTRPPRPSFVEKRQNKSFDDPLPRSKVKTINTAKLLGPAKPMNAKINGEEKNLRQLDRMLYFQMLMFH